MTDLDEDDGQIDPPPRWRPVIDPMDRIQYFDPSPKGSLSSVPKPKDAK